MANPRVLRYRVACLIFLGVLWNGSQTSAQQPLTIQTNVNWVHSVTFSPDGTTIAAGLPEGMVRIWDSATGSEVRTIRGVVSNSRFSRTSYSTDQQRIIAKVFPRSV